jgi:hypothetical protein
VQRDELIEALQGELASDAGAGCQAGGAQAETVGGMREIARGRVLAGTN